MRHVLGVLGVLAAAVLLAVSAAMNWRFGYSLGKTEMDGMIYGSASAAADCFKALVPFFFFAAVRNRIWSQAAAAAVVWVVVLAYSLTSALGHAALNRLDTAGQRAAHAQSYQDLRADLKRAEEQLGWIPQHRPAQTVQAEIDGLKLQPAWRWSKECTEIKGSQTRGLCQKYQGLTSEFASAEQADVLGKRIDEVRSKMTNATGDGTQGSALMSEADPQAAVLSKLVSFVGMGKVKVEDMQTALTIFIALLLEVGSGFGMYVAFSTWRLNDREAPSVPQLEPAIATVVAPAMATIGATMPTDVWSEADGGLEGAPRAQRLLAPVSDAIANDNRDEPVHRPRPPDSEVERFAKEAIYTRTESSVEAWRLFQHFNKWCEERGKRPLDQPNFARELQELGVMKTKVRGKIYYVGIAIKAAHVSEDEKRPTVTEPGTAAQAA
ncbi:MAG: hypothetical protein AB7L90_17165 [Hyphomicrobiaceae bacterium]